MNANNGSKIFSSYAPSNIDCTNLAAMYTFPLAINDMSNGAFINSPGQTGTIVGYYFDASENEHGFANSGGVCTSIDVGGAVGTAATGINNLGEVVGWWYDGTTYHGFFEKAGAAPVTINYPGATAGGTQFLGINDAGQILGTASVSGPLPQAFLYYQGAFDPIGNATSNSLFATGINGDATVVGYLNNFEDPLLPPSWTGTAVAVSVAGRFSAINSNNEVVGSGYSSSSCPGGDCGFLWSDNVVLTVLTFSDYGTSTYGINDFGQIVGDYEEPSGSHGGLWVPQ